MQSAAEGPSEIAVDDRIRCGDVVDTVHFPTIDRPFDRSDHVLPIDPRHPLPSTPNRTAHSEPERQHHFLERATFPCQHHTETENHHSRDFFRCARSLFPLTDHVGEKTFALRRTFIENLVAARTVIADG